MIYIFDTTEGEEKARIYDYKKHLGSFHRNKRRTGVHFNGNFYDVQRVSLMY